MCAVAARKASSGEPSRWRISRRSVAMAPRPPCVSHQLVNGRCHDEDMPLAVETQLEKLLQFHVETGIFSMVREWSLFVHVFHMVTRHDILELRSTFGNIRWGTSTIANSFDST